MKLISKTAWCFFLTVSLCLSAGVNSQTPEPQPLEEPSDTSMLPSETRFAETIAKLNSRSFSTKTKIAKEIANIEDKRVLPLLKLMVEGELFYKKPDETTEGAAGIIVTVEKVDEGLSLTDFLTGKNLGVVGSRQAKKITVNNKLRGTLRTLIANIELSSANPAERESAARDMIKNPDDKNRTPLTTAIDAEKNKSVKHLMAVALAMLDVNSEDPTTRLTAIDVLGESVEPESVAKLRSLLVKDESGKQYLEQDTEVITLAETKLKSIETKLRFYKVASDLMFGLSLGSVLLLAAIGLAITFGVMGVINMAHGEMIMLGAYTTFAIQQLFPDLITYSLFIAVPTAFLVSGSVGVLIERLVIRHLYGRPLDTLLATFGISLIIQQAVRTYRANNVPVVNPEWISGSWVLNGAFSLTYNRIYIIIFALFILALLMFLLKKTMFGLQMRAVTQNRAMANSMGIRSNWIDALTFGLGSGIAGIAGVALSQLTNVGPNLGQSYIIDSFMVVVFGGVGNLMGTFVAAMSLGVVNKFLEPVTGAVIAKIMVLVFIILFIQKRPRGLFALKGRFVED